MNELNGALPPPGGVEECVYMYSIRILYIYSIYMEKKSQICIYICDFFSKWNIFIYIFILYLSYISILIGQTA